MDDTELSIVASGDVTGVAEASVILGWTRVTGHNRDGLIGRIPRRPLTSAFFAKTAAINLAVKVISPSSLPPCSTPSLLTSSS